MKTIGVLGSLGPQATRLSACLLDAEVKQGVQCESVMHPREHNIAQDLLSR